MTDYEGKLVYLYGIVPADAPEPDAALEGIEGGYVRLLRAGRVAAVISDVPEQLYGDEALNGRLDDLAWVGGRGMEHERVLDWYVEQGAVLPLSLFSLHRDEARVRGRLESEEDAYHRALDKLSGRKEWGIKLWRNESEAAEGIDRLSASLQVLNEELEAAPPGRRFLLARKRDAMRAEEVRALSSRIAHDVFSALRAAADAAVSIRLPAGVAARDRTLLLHAAYLVRDDGFATFQAAVTGQAADLNGSGFEIEFTGPWPPYNFTGDDDEEDVDL